MKNNILEFCLSPDLGGLELFMVHCHTFFKENTPCYIAVAPHSKLDAYLQEEKIYIKRNKFFPFLPALKLAKIIDSNNIDIVHFHWTKDMPTVVLAKLFSKRKPKIVQTRNMTMTRFKNDFYHTWLYKNIDMIHAVTNQVKAQLEQFIPQKVRPKIEMVYMGCEASNVTSERVAQLKSHYALANEFVVGIVGRIEEGKGQHIVIEAIAKLKDLPMKALIVGHAMEEAYLHTLQENIKKLGIEDKIIFTGFTKEVNEHMRLFDVNILATPRETFGLVIIESMANGICTLATANGGPLEIIEDGRDGLLFERTADDLAKKLLMLYNNPQMKEQLALTGQKKAEEIFNKTVQLNKLYKSFEILEKL